MVSFNCHIIATVSFIMQTCTWGHKTHWGRRSENMCFSYLRLDFHVPKMCFVLVSVISRSRRTHSHTCLCQGTKSHWNALYSFIYFQADGIVLYCEKQLTVNKEQTLPPPSRTGLHCDMKLHNLGFCILILLFTLLLWACVHGSGT